MFGLIGPDGAGKTTAIRADVRPAARRRGRGARARPRSGARAPRASPTRSATSRSASASTATSRSTRTSRSSPRFTACATTSARRDQLLDMTQLTPFRARLADRLSGGMKQKLALACTLVHEPELILLDEPTTGVDPVSRREFWKLLSEFLAQRHHDPDVHAVPGRSRALHARGAAARGPRCSRSTSRRGCARAHAGPHGRSHRAERRRGCRRRPRAARRRRRAGVRRSAARDARRRRATRRSSASARRCRRRRSRGASVRPLRRRSKMSSSRSSATQEARDA